MIIRRRSSFSRLLNLVRRVERDQSDLRAVRQINRLVLAEIQRAERTLRRHRDVRRELTRTLKVDRPDKGTSKIIRVRIKRASDRIAEQEDQIFIWKCFGDALTFVYLDKFSIKHAFFEIDQLGIKPDAGQISGKDGLDKEVACLEAVLEHGIPAVMCDITNVLRYGDVCLLAYSDPHMLEVKSAPRLSGRGQRQIEKIKRLHEFLATDKAEMFRGILGTTVRTSVDIPERNNVDALNECITVAKEKGHAISSPEPGLSFVAIYGEVDMSDVLARVPGRPTLGFILNTTKNEHAWSPFVPFILTIRDPDRLLDFIEGRLFLIVLIDPEPLCQTMSFGGWTVRYLPEGNYALHCFHPEERSYIAVSRQLLFRAAYEFASLSWIGEVHRSSIEKTAEYVRDFGSAREGDSKMEKTANYIRRLRDVFGEGHPWIKEMSPS
jgi:hypothetical protein